MTTSIDEKQKHEHAKTTQYDDDERIFSVFFFLTDFKLSLNTSFTSFSIFNLGISIGIHHINEFPRESSMLNEIERLDSLNFE